MPDCIGAYGNSAGANLSLMLALATPAHGLEGDGPHREQSSAIQAACVSAVPTDFSSLVGEANQRDRSVAGAFEIARDHREHYLAGPPETLAERVRSASPISYVRKDGPPLLLIHGTADSILPVVAQADAFYEKLTAAGANDITYLRYEGGSHNVFAERAAETAPARDAFFKRTLGL